MRVICVAGRPGKRHGMGDVGDQAEAQGITERLVAFGVPREFVVPNAQRPLGRPYATSTVDEVGILVEEGLTPVERYSASAPLALVLHRRHGQRALDIWRKVGFRRDQLLLLAPASGDTSGEVFLRAAYRLFVLGPGGGTVAPQVLRRREERFYSIGKYALARR